MVLALCSCSSTKTLEFVKLNEGNILFKTIETPKSKKILEGREHSVVIYESKAGAKVKLELKENEMKMKPNDLEKEFDSLGVIPTETDLENDTGKRLHLLDAYSYPEKFNLKDNQTKKEKKGNLIALIQSKGEADKTIGAIAELDFNLLFEEERLNQDNDFKKSIPLRFNDNKLVFQTLTIPFKIRGKEGDIPSTVATNFNAGIAYGHQWNLSRAYPIYGEDEKMVGYELEQLSFSLAPFAGLTTVALTAKNTEPDITTDQTVIGLSIGAAGVFSFNRLNLGLALGIDHGFGKANDWIYQDKLWTGIVIGLDLIK